MIEKGRDNMYKLAPSLLAADFGILKEQIAQLDEAKVPYLHLDIMDGVFVPNLSFGLAVVESIRKYTKMVFDVHLMIVEPERYVEQFAKAGADIFCFHIEATRDAKATIAKIKECKMKVGIAVKPATPLSKIKELLSEVDMVLVMTVEPGFGGQKFMQEQMVKVEELVKIREENKYNYDIEVDGGINPETLKTCFASGANVIVAGSAILGAQDISARVEEFAQIATEYNI